MGFTDGHYFIILYNAQNMLNIKKVQAKEKKGDDPDDPVWFPCHMGHCFHSVSQ